MAERKTWVWVVLGIMGVFLLLVVAGIGGMVYFVRSHAHAETTPRDTALAEIEKVRARFAGQTPLIELKLGDEPVIHRVTTGERHEIQTLHVIGYDRQNSKLSRVDVPGWVVRFVSAGGRFRLANLGFEDETDSKLTLEDLERHGPGIIFDLKRREEAMAVVWIE
jgi:hypothetical protein